MKARRVIARLLISAAFFAAGAACAAAQQPARASSDGGRGNAAEPPVRWSEVQVEFEGNRLFTAEQLLGLARQCYEGYRKDEPVFDQATLDQCLKRDVLDFMRRSGYVRAEIGEVKASQSWPGVKVTVPVKEGELYRLGDIKIDGAEFFPAEKLRELLPLKKGEIADGEAIVRWLSEHLRKDYEDNGFIQYEYAVDPQFRPTPGAENEGVVDFLVTITEGRRFILRRIEFKGNERTPEDVLRGALLVKEGEVFKMQEFRDSVGKLNDLGLFEPIDADRDCEFRDDGETIDLFITIRVKEKSQAAGGSQAPPSNL